MLLQCYIKIPIIIIPMLYMAYNPSYNSSYVVPPIITSSQYTLPINLNQTYIHPMTQQLLVSGTPSNVSISISPYGMSSTIQQQTAPSTVTSTNQQQNDSSLNYLCIKL